MILEEIVGQEESAEHRHMYPPSQKMDLERMAKYIAEKKRIPPLLPQKVRDAEEKDFRKVLIPEKNFCLECEGVIPLAEPVLITKKTKIITLTTVITGE